MHPTTTTGRRAAAALAATVLLLTGCGSDSTEESSGATVSIDPSAELAVDGAWARTSPMTATNGAVYFVIAGGAEDDVLLSASVDPSVAAAAEVHETVMVDDMDMNAGDGEMSDDMGDGATSDEMDMDAGDGESDDHGGMAGGMTMQEVERVEVPAGGTVTFEPGGHHVMLVDLVEPLELGSTFDVTLTFETAGEIIVPVEVRDS